MSVAVIVQARMGSSRLPGKVLLPLAGAPMLQRLIERLRRVRRADALVVATTTLSSDEPIAALCGQLGVGLSRGSELDVLSRYGMAARACSASVVVRITADCPLIDPSLIDRCIDEFMASGCDYLSNMHPPTWPYGMAVEVLSASALHTADREAMHPAEREHVTPYVWGHPERFRLHNLALPDDLSHHRWTVDTAEDYALVSRIFDTLHVSKPDFEMADVLVLLERHPDWVQINRHVVQKSAAEFQSISR